MFGNGVTKILGGHLPPSPTYMFTLIIRNSLFILTLLKYLVYIVTHGSTWFLSFMGG